jgi:hypothetical protein
MPLPLTGVVGAPSSTSAPDGSALPILQGKQSEAMVSELHGKYYTQTYRGNLFWAATAFAGVTLTIATGTSPTFVLWNPQGSGKNAVLVSIIITPTTAMTTASGYGYGFLINTGASLATAAPFSAFTQITATRGNGLLGQPAGQNASVLLVASAATLTTGATAMRAMGASAGTGAITAPAQQPIMREDFDGTLILQPGSAMVVGTTIATSGQTATHVTAVWYEAPL